MKWVTRARVKVDRVACPWLIKKFVDPEAEFLFVPADRIVVDTWPVTQATANFPMALDEENQRHGCLYVRACGIR